MLWQKKNTVRDVLRKKTPTRHLSQLQKQTIFGALLFIFCAVCILGVYKITHIESLQIANIIVVGGETIPERVIISEIDSVLNGSYFRLIPKRFTFLYPNEELAQQLKKNDRIKQVHIEKKSRTEIAVLFEEYTPHALVCADEEDDICFLMDSTGFAFAKAPLLEGSAFVRYTAKEAEVTVRTQQLEASFAEETTVFIEQLKEKLGLYVIAVMKDGNLDVSYELSGGGVIKVSQSIPMQTTFDNLYTILQSEEFKHIEPGSFQYIDLRFGDKVFLNEAPVGSATSTASTTPDEGDQ